MDRVTALLTWCETSILNAFKIKNFITSVFLKKSVNRKVIHCSGLLFIFQIVNLNQSC